MKTAVDFLVDKLSYSTSDGTIISHHKIITKLVEQAKAMEKDEIMTALNFGYSDGRDNVKTWNSSEGYYNWRYNVTNK